MGTEGGATEVWTAESEAAGEVGAYSRGLGLREWTADASARGSMKFKISQSSKFVIVPVLKLLIQCEIGRFGKGKKGKLKEFGSTQLRKD